MIQQTLSLLYWSEGVFFLFLGVIYNLKTHHATNIQFTRSYLRTGIL